ncbi:hypothetical protein TWF694_007174 [Orbilia ellipsospora]|uniref:Myb-like domain-containing protein n=1 Tax=Orbilia ellipsospora TaxID=2528407 RepID=A0AAV9XIE7_9PEZI
MATQTDALRQKSSLPSPHSTKNEDCYVPWPSAGWHSNRGPVPSAQEEDLEESDYNNSQDWYSIHHTEHSGMGSITYSTNESIETHPTSSYSSYRSNLSASPPVTGRKSSIYRPVPPLVPSMNVVSSNVSPGLPGQRKPHYTPASIGSPNLYGSSPRTSNLNVGNGSISFPSQLPNQLQLKYNDLTPISENQASSLPSSFTTAAATTLAPPPMNRTSSGTIFKSNEKRLFNTPNLPQIPFHQNSPDAPPPGDTKTEYGTGPQTIFGHSGSPYQRHEYDEGVHPMYIALPGLASGHPTPFTSGAGPNTYFTPHAHHIDGVPTGHPQGLLTEAFGEPNIHYRKREYSVIDTYPQWSSPDGLPIQKPPKRRKSSATQPWQLSEDDRYLMKLKDEDQLPWKEIVNRFKEDGRGTHRVPALQMRLKRIKERIRQWTPEDVNHHHQFFLPNSRCYPVRQPQMLIRATS